MASYDIDHVTSCQHYPQNNGKERQNLLKESKTAGSDYLALLEWRNIPSEGLDSSPVQRMFTRRTRTLIPTTSELLKPKIVEDVQEKLVKTKQLQAKYYNISAKELPALSQGEIVRVKPTDRSGRWFKARVERQVDVRSYEVRTEDGKVLRRNRIHLRNSKEPAYIRDNLEPISMPVKTQQSESPTISKPADRPLKPSAPLEVPLPRNPKDVSRPKEPESSSQSVKVSEQFSLPNQLTVQLPEVVECPDHQVT